MTLSRLPSAELPEERGVRADPFLGDEAIDDPIELVADILDCAPFESVEGSVPTSESYDVRRFSSRFPARIVAAMSFESSR